jgi:hypothetical protein
MIKKIYSLLFFIGSSLILVSCGTPNPEVAIALKDSILNQKPPSGYSRAFVCGGLLYSNSALLGYHVALIQGPVGPFNLTANGINIGRYNRDETVVLDFKGKASLHFVMSNNKSYSQNLIINGITNREISVTTNMLYTQTDIGFALKSGSTMIVSPGAGNLEIHLLKTDSRTECDNKRIVQYKKL